jgi:antitoxin FitA
VLPVTDPAKRRPSPFVESKMRSVCRCVAHKPICIGHPGEGLDWPPEMKPALWRYRRHYGAVPSIQIKDVPEETHAVLRRRAAAARQSLQEYLRGRLIEEASGPTVDEVLERAGGRAGGSVSFAEATAAQQEDRDRR